MRKLDIFSQPPQIYILQQKANKTTFGGVVCILFMLFILFISLLYIFDFILNEKYEIEYLKYYTPMQKAQKELLDSNPEYNPKISFIFDGTNYIKNNYSSNFAFYLPASKKYYENVNIVNITENVSSFHLELLYRCNGYDDNECSLRETDKSISKYQNYFGFDFGHSTFILDHSKPDPFERGHISFSNYLFCFNNTVSYSLFWKVIKYKNERTLFQFLDSWRGIKNEFIEGYIDKRYISPLPPTYRIRTAGGSWFLGKYKVIGKIQMFNLHEEYEEYKRKDVKFLSVLANILSLFTSIKGIISAILTVLYSTSFDNHKMVKTVLLKKFLKKKEKFFPLQNFTDLSDSDNKIEKLDINKVYDDNNEEENLHLEKLSWTCYLLNNIYCRKYKCNIQERIELCNEIIKKYMSYEYILYNQLMLEQLLIDYKWNDNSLKNLVNNNLIDKLKFLELGNLDNIT